MLLFLKLVFLVMVSAGPPTEPKITFEPDTLYKTNTSTLFHPSLCIRWAYIAFAGSFNGMSCSFCKKHCSGVWCRQGHPQNPKSALNPTKCRKPILTHFFIFPYVSGENIFPLQEVSMACDAPVSKVIVLGCGIGKLTQRTQYQPWARSNVENQH